VAADLMPRFTNKKLEESDKRSTHVVELPFGLIFFEEFAVLRKKGRETPRKAKKAQLCLQNIPMPITPQM
jgi:hypothetical protein